MSESLGAVAALIAAKYQDTYPFTVVGTHHRRMDQWSDETRYFILDCNTGARWYKRDTKTGEVTTFVACDLAHEAAGWLAAGRVKEYNEIAPHYTVVKVCAAN